MNLTREQRTERALYRGDMLTLQNPRYLETVRGLTVTLFRDDLASFDLTSKALGLRERDVRAAVISRGGGVAAGLEEFAHLLRERGIAATFKIHDGDTVRHDETLLEVSGSELTILAVERVGLNLLQRMSGIATAARCLQQRARRSNESVRIVGTRKTPWGLLDKRALHLGGVGTHRLGLSDAILIKNNHLSLIAQNEEEAAPIAIERAWKSRRDAAFIEIEVRSEGAARAAAQKFRRLLEHEADEYPCLLMLDNMAPDRISGIIELLQSESLWDCVLLEASGGISEASVEAYAATGVDAISIGALTHSARALDICLRIE
jgi:nicotinate-nucleotide pyrophosphorylase (carboxylating)